jgi:hypothetical protein
MLHRLKPVARITANVAVLTPTHAKVEHRSNCSTQEGAKKGEGRFLGGGRNRPSKQRKEWEGKVMLLALSL